MDTAFIVVVSFQTTQENHHQARQLIGDYIKDFLSLQPGFIESWLHEKRPGPGLLHYARWTSEEDFRAFASLAASHPDLPAIREFQPDAGFYEVFAAY